MTAALLEPIGRCRVMGVVNVTPDSFSDGGRWFDLDRAVRHGLELVEAGADLVDVGGESTRPGATRVDLDEELRRVVPVVRALAAGGAAVSVDTMRAAVAEAALDAGAVLVGGEAGVVTVVDVEVLGRALAPGAPPDAEVERLVGIAVASAGIEDGHVAVEFVDAERIAELVGAGADDAG